MNSLRPFMTTVYVSRLTKNIHAALLTVHFQGVSLTKS